ncbi:MAG: cytoplasmic protein, partial [Candidatus Omnitrophica bacterium]|nr:cytoplasmic protein [Candidatus Omnitrophota bacterium]
MKSQKINYPVLIDTISKIHEQAQAGAAGAVNRFLVLRNWLIGAYIVEYEQKGKDRAEYGSGLMEKISCDLRARGVNGLGISMLKNCRQFYKIYPQFRQPAVGEFKRLGDDSAIRQSLISELDIHVVTSSVTEKTGPKPLSVESLFNFSWTHFIEFIMIEDAWKRAFYENECLKGNWSKRQLQRQIGSLLYERTGLSTDKKAVINAGRKQAAEAPQVIAGLIRDPYVLEFTGLAELP